MKYKLVIFDFDGTLADSFPWFRQVFNTLADTYHFKCLDDSEIETLRGYSAQQLLQHLGIAWWKVPLIGWRARKMAAQQIEQIHLFAGIDQLLQQLTQAGVRLALVTSNNYANVQRVLGPENAALITHFECGTAMFGKAARFRRVLRQSGVLAHEALCIGDELRDLEAAVQAGIPFGAVAWGFTRANAFEVRGPAEVFRQVDEILERVVAN